MHNNRKAIFIVGSKPEAIFPNIQPDIVYAVNGAINRVQFLKNKSELIGIISNYVFSLNTEQAKLTRTILSDCKVDKLITTSLTLKRKQLLHPKSINLLYKNFEHINAYIENYLKLKFVKKNSLLKKIIYDDSIVGIVDFINCVLTGNKPKELKISTGIFSLVLALSRSTSPADIYVIGIGLEKGSKHFYDQSKVYDPRNKHIDCDKFFLQNINKKKLENSKIIFTDNDLCF